jgi:RNA polymerase sigma-70 factor, ECF subfamily
MLHDPDRMALRMKSLDEEAVREFASMFGPRLRSFLIHLGADPAESESLAMTCISDAVLKLDRFESRGPGSFRAWVLTLARDAWLDERRRRGRALQALPDSIAAVSTACDVTETPKISAEVLRALESLSETDRQIIHLRYFEGCQSFEEIGRRVNLSEGAARVRHHRALRTLERLLAGCRLSGGKADRPDPQTTLNE